MVSSTSSKEGITKLDKIFASYGIPETMVSDNGSCSVSVEFKNFLAKCGPFITLVQMDWLSGLCAHLKKI